MATTEKVEIALRFIDDCLENVAAAKADGRAAWLTSEQLQAIRVCVEKDIPVSYSDLSIIYLGLSEIADFLSHSNERNKGRNARLDAIEAQLSSIDAILKSLSFIVGEGSARAPVSIDQRLKALEAHNEERPGLKYREVYQEGVAYKRGDCVTWGGSLWIAMSDTRVHPRVTAAGGRDWRLAVKAGRPGKDGKDSQG